MSALPSYSAMPMPMGGMPMRMPMMGQPMMSGSVQMTSSVQMPMQTMPSMTMGAPMMAAPQMGNSFPLVSIFSVIMHAYFFLFFFSSIIFTFLLIISCTLQEKSLHPNTLGFYMPMRAMRTIGKPQFAQPPYYSYHDHNLRYHCSTLSLGSKVSDGFLFCGFFDRFRTSHHHCVTHYHDNFHANTSGFHMPMQAMPSMGKLHFVQPP